MGFILLYSSYIGLKCFYNEQVKAGSVSLLPLHFDSLENNKIPMEIDVGENFAQTAAILWSSVHSLARNLCFQQPEILYK